MEHEGKREGKERAEKGRRECFRRVQYRSALALSVRDRPTDRPPVGFVVVPMSLLQSKLEGDALLRKCELEIRTLHAIFVTWFRGEKPLVDLRQDLQQRMVSEFSHIAPNGHMVKGRDVLLQYLTDKYGCYQDRVFSIDVYNVELLWSSKELCLASYEEWQSWDDEASENSETAESAGSTGGGGGGGKQQFGRLSTCLLQRSPKEGPLHWIHVHETWMEAEEPVVKKNKGSAQATIDQLKDDETVMTGPVPPSEIQHRFTATTAGPHTNTSLQNQPHHPGMIRANDDDDDSSDDEDEDDNDEDEEPTESSSEAYVAVNPRSSSSVNSNSNTPSTQNVIPKSNVTSSNKPPKDVEVGTAPVPANDGDATKNVAVVTATITTTTTTPVEQEQRGVPNAAQPTRPEPPLTPAEQQFMENSQGILFFEDEDEPPAVAIKPNTMTLDDLMEADEDEISKDPSFLQNHAQLADEMNSSQAMLSLYSVADTSHKRHVSPKLEQYAVPLKWEDTLVGVSIAGFDIGTSQGPIADSQWYAATTATLEESAQFRTASAGDAGADQTKRKIVLPEMVFPVAHVAMEGHGIWMSWDATDCLGSWASSHASIPVHSTTAATTTTTPTHNGVSVLQSKDAALWRDKRRQPQQQNAALDGTDNYSDAAAIFHYDWTYSTPFSVKMEGGEWIELDESGMRMELLTDQAVPILFFDDIVLYEDDLHDNGQVKYSIKLRIMPTCAYILARLWVRVDHVMVRLRETRVLVDFFGIQPQVYRDLTWRECAWNDLAKHGLPTAIQAWSCDGDGSGGHGETAEWHNLVQQLPEVSLPDDFIQHAVLEYGI